MNKVYLAGAGPGDPELITLKTRRVLEQADSVLYDHLAPIELLDLAPPSAERVYVGKKKSEHAVTQDEICEMLVERGRRGLNVVRLKGGDPFIFGRGGEEAEALANAGLPFEVIPGVTTPLGIAAYTGVPLTHRDHTSAVTFVTGHDVEKIDWAKVGACETIVVFMGLSHIADIAGRIIAAGRSPDTPALAVRWATRPDQQTIIGTLATLPDLIAQQAMRPPATIVIGEVVALRSQLDWFEKLPLFGRRIIVTRAREQSAALAAPLRRLGASVIELPAIEIRPASNYAPLDRAIEDLAAYNWLIFTSVNGVKFFLDRLDKSTVDLRRLRARICAIGPATRDALGAAHLKTDIMAAEYVAEGLLDALSEIDLTGARVLIARAAVARDILPNELRQRGATVDVVEAYRTLAPDNLPARAAEALASKPDFITFTSTSTVENLLSAVPSDQLRDIEAVSIGPVTTAALRKWGVRRIIEATEYTAAGIVEAICAKAIIGA
jgi:uroporphyrinogen III methyltransferase / synthase